MLTEEEERILKLIVTQTKASIKVQMERENSAVTIKPLQEAEKLAFEVLKEECR